MYTADVVPVSILCMCMCVCVFRFFVSLKKRESSQKNKKLFGSIGIAPSLLRNNPPPTHIDIFFPISLKFRIDSKILELEMKNSYKEREQMIKTIKN